MTSDAPRDIRSGRPFQQTALEYLRLGWYPVPLPEKDKFPPVTGFTGRDSLPIDKVQISEWLDNPPKGEKANIGLSMGPVVPPKWYQRSRKIDWFMPDGSPRFITVGIDVDHYTKGKEKKVGGDELAELEKELGPLPPTWISTARDDGISGIRYFLAPANLEYRGKAAPNIDIVSHTYRFAVVGPSYHPEGGLYRWFAPGQQPQGPGSVPMAQVGHLVSTSTPREEMGAPRQKRKRRITQVPAVAPQAWTLPELPEMWLRFLSRDFTPYSSRPIDMETGVDELWTWAQENFSQEGGGWDREAGDDRAGDEDLSGPAHRLAELEALGCSLVKKKVEYWAEQVLNDATSHDKIVDGSWNILNMGAEGHAGWHVATRVLEDIWLEHVLSTGKRGMDEAAGEMFRERTNALRKIKAKVEKVAEETGADWTNRVCACYDGDEGIDGGEFTPEFDAAGDPGEYTKDDDGNAAHLNDLFPGQFHFVDGYGRWIHWDGQVWTWDNDEKIRRAWRVVKDRQRSYGEGLLKKAVATDDGDMKKRAKAWLMWAQQSGNNSRAEHAVKALRSFPGIWLDSAVPDGNEYLLGVANGVIELTNDGAHLRQARKEDMVVNNTGVPFVELKDQLRAGGAIAEGARMWQDFLDTFHDREMQVWIQQLLGMCLVGFNPKKKLIFFYGERNTGKSTFLNTVMKALGSDYSRSSSMNIFDGRNLNPQLADALSARLLVVPEAAGDQNADSETLKRISGNDVMTAEYKGVNKVVSRVPAFTVVFAANDSPRLTSYDEALQDRFEVVPFTKPQPKSEKGHNIEEACSMAALGWMVEGWRMFCRDQLGTRPAGLDAVRKEFDENVTALGSFLADCVELTGDQNDMETRTAVYQAYEAWCTRTNEKPFSSRKFGLEMKAAGYPSAVARVEGGKTARVHKGLRLLDEGNVRRFRVTKEGS
ncbi:DNA primase/polymerase [Gordonia phage LittleFella]|nr:DNA primase/polymerase [Gordonia phage LittleFella]